MQKANETKTLEATLDALQPIREMITDASKSVGLDKKQTYNLCLAVDEIATNIILHGYEENDIANGKVDVTISTDDNSIEVILEDDAVPFDPLHHNVPDEEALSKSLEDRPIGGLGVMIAQKSVDEYKYEYKDKRNRNIFITRLHTQGA